MRLTRLFSCALLFFCSICHADLSHREDVRAFMYRMNAKYGYPLSDLQHVFKGIQINFSILQLMSKPAEKKPCYSYREITLSPQRIEDGIQFWRKHEKILKKAEERYGVPAKIIVGIIGVETLYGKNVGTFKVAEALATLGFEGESRNEFFLSELEQFLLVSRDLHWNPLEPVGSYAGAMGIPQFMPSNIRRFGATAEPFRRIDLIHNPNDAIMSVANYLYKHGWDTSGMIAAKAQMPNTLNLPWNK